MGKNKLKKFAEMDRLPNVYQFPFAAIHDRQCELRGCWGEKVFGNSNPIVVELGCGKGEYAVGLARRFPEKNYIGIDIKGARMWTGAKQAHAEGLPNVAFLRTNIELIDRFFAPGEVSEIWITFPDPQMRKVRKRLTSTRFMELYRLILKPNGLVHLKTDSPFLYTYTDAMVALNNLPVEVNTADLYHSGLPTTFWKSALSMSSNGSTADSPLNTCNSTSHPTPRSPSPTLRLRRTPTAASRAATFSARSCSTTKNNHIDCIACSGLHATAP